MFHFKILENLFRNSQVSSLELISHHNFPRGLPEEKNMLDNLYYNFVVCLPSGHKRSSLPQPTLALPPPVPFTQQPPQLPRVKRGRPVTAKPQWEEPNQLLCQPTWMSSK